MPILKYKHISRTMSEINEEMEKLISQVDTVKDLQSVCVAGIFCEWLCRISNVAVSDVLALAKGGEKALDKGVPLEDVNEFFIGKLQKLFEERDKIEKS